MPLEHLRIVEVGTMFAAAYCGRLLADFGAEVIKIEPPGGDIGRHAAPLIDIGNGLQQSGYFAYLNYNKKSVVLDVARPDDAVRLCDLIGTADVLIDSLSADERRAAGIDHQTLHRICPQLVVANVSWFGDSGPYRDFRSTDSVCRALAGLVKLVGAEEGPPLALPDYQACIVGGVSSFIPVMAALLARLEGAAGRVFEISVHEANVTLAELQISPPYVPDGGERRWGINKFWPSFPLGIYPCKTGWLGVTISTPAQWQTFCKLLGMPELGDHPDYYQASQRLVKAAELEARFAPRFLERTAEEWFAQALEHRLPLATVPDMSQVLLWDVFRQRDGIVPIRMGSRTIEAPGSALNLTQTPPIPGGAAPRLGEHTREILDGARRESAAFVPIATPAHTRLPLEGLRIIDLSMGWAGPLVTRNLADLGADVIKVEACRYPDWWRGMDNRPEAFEQMLYEKSNRFNIMNRNKRAITLDLTVPDGVRLVKDLVKGADALVENYSAEVLPKLGLDYARLLKVNPSLVMMSMPAFGSQSAWRDCRAYGSTLEQASGLPSVTGFEDGPPVMNHIALGDAIGGLHAASALLTALLHRKRTGTGQFIDLSQVQCVLALTAAWVIEQSAFGKIGPRRGNRHPMYAPHGVFRCAGDDEWILIAITNDVMWLALCETMACDDLARDFELMDVKGRRQRESEIERAVEMWTQRRSSDAAMEELQRAGVAAGALRSPGSLFQDPHLNARGFWQMVDRPFIGTHAQPSAPYRENGRPYSVRWPAATLGQYNEQVLRDVLHLSLAEIQRAEAERVIGTKAVPPSQRNRKSKRSAPAQGAGLARRATQ